jgi:hypothetical protein
MRMALMHAANATKRGAGQVGQLPCFLPYSTQGASRARATPLIWGYLALLPYLGQLVIKSETRNSPKC